jgi:hypothetical protein
MSAQWQAEEAVSVAALPADADDALLELCGPGGCERLDGLSGADLGAAPVEAAPWRTWVDEVVSWAAALLGNPALAAAARSRWGSRSRVRWWPPPRGT